MTADHIVGMVADSKSRQVGDYVQPLCISVGGRRTLRVTERHEAPHSLLRGVVCVTYQGVEVDGTVHDFWPSDDPRPATEQEWREEA